MLVEGCNNLSFLHLRNLVVVATGLLPAFWASRFPFGSPERSRENKENISPKVPFCGNTGGFFFFSEIRVRLFSNFVHRGCWENELVKRINKIIISH